MKISLMMPVWKRFKYIDTILKSWIPQVDEILVWDNSGGFKTSLPVSVVNSQKNFGSHIKFKSAQLLDNDMVIISDDDIIPGKDLVHDLVDGFKGIGQNNAMKKQEIIVTILGRQFLRESYQANPSHRANSISKIVEVDWGGRLLFGHRLNFTINISGCFDMRLDDLFWSYELRRQRPRAKIFVVPTKEWKNSPDASDKFSIYHTPGYWKLRNDFVKHHHKELLG